MKWTRKYGPLAAGCLSLLAVSLVLYFLLDTVFNGVFVDWVESTFMLTWEEYVPSAGTYGIVQHINWHWVKPFLLGVLVVNGLLGAGAVFLTRQLARGRKSRRTSGTSPNGCARPWIPMGTPARSSRPSSRRSPPRWQSGKASSSAGNRPSSRRPPGKTT